MRVVALLFALAACGRLDFAERTVDASDASVDVAALGHDEDGDGIPDSMDPCPHIAMGGTTDTDGDGVGDACDPNPAVATEHWVKFATMQAGDTAFDDITGFSQEADSIRSPDVAMPYVTLPVGKVRVDMGWNIHSVLTTATQHQVAYGVDQNTGNPEFYFGELNDNSGAADVAIVSYDMTAGYVMLDTMNPGLLHAGAGMSRLDCDTTHHYVAGWQGQMYTLTAATPGYAGGKGIRFALNGIDVSIDYLAIIATN